MRAEGLERVRIANDRLGLRRRVERIRLREISRARAPASVPVYASIGATQMRRLLLPRTRYQVYFAIEPEAIVIHAIWHAVRGETPNL